MKVTCPYCNGSAEYVSSSEVYGGRDYGKIYLCRPCQAWVGVHKGTKKPLGRLADAKLRQWKIKAHQAFDPIWKEGHMNRYQAYKWLSIVLGIPRKKCHIGMFDIKTCQKVIEVTQGKKAA